MSQPHQCGPVGNHDICRYSCKVLVFRMVIFIDHMHEIVYSVTSLSPWKSHCHNSILRYSLGGKGCHPSSARIWSIFLNTVEGHQSVVFVGVYQLVMIHHIVDHHSSKIPIGEIGIVLIHGIAHSHTLFDGM